MRKVAVDRSLARWQRLMLVLGVLVAAWGPAHLAEVTAINHGIDGLAHSHSPGSQAVGSHRAANSVPDAQDILRAFRAPGERDDHRCGHRDADRDATQATAVRLPEPDAVSGLPAAAPGDREPLRGLTDVRELRAPPGQALLIVVCVWRQ